MALTAQTDRQILKLAQSGQVGSTQTGMAVDPLTPVTGAVAAAHTKFYTLPVCDAATAGTDVLEAGVMIPVRGKVVSVAFVNAVAITQSATLFKTLTLKKYTAGAAGATVWAQKTDLVANGGMGTLLAFQGYASVQGDFTAANQQLAAGDVLTIQSTHASTGTAISQTDLIKSSCRVGKL